MKIEVINTGTGNLVEISAEGFTGKLYRFPRHQLELIKKSNLIASSGNNICYILFNNHFDKQKYGNDIYIGQSSNGIGRIIDHNKNKDDWNQVLIVSPDDFDMDSLYRLESDLIKRIKYSMNFKSSNIKNEDRGILCSCQKVSYDKFLRNLYEIIDALYIDIFSINTNGLLYLENHKNCFARIIDAQEGIIEIISGSEMDYVTGYMNDDFFATRGIKTIEKPTETSLRGNVMTGNFYIFEKDETIKLSELKHDNLKYKFKNTNGIKLYSILNEINDKKVNNTY